MQMTTAILDRPNIILYPKQFRLKELNIDRGKQYECILNE